MPDRLIRRLYDTSPSFSLALYTYVSLLLDVILYPFYVKIKRSIQNQLSKSASVSCLENCNSWPPWAFSTKFTSFLKYLVWWHIRCQNQKLTQFLHYSASDLLPECFLNPRFSSSKTMVPYLFISNTKPYKRKYSTLKFTQSEILLKL